MHSAAAKAGLPTNADEIDRRDQKYVGNSHRFQESHQQKPLEIGDQGLRRGRSFAGT